MKDITEWFEPVKPWIPQNKLKLKIANTEIPCPGLTEMRTLDVNNFTLSSNSQCQHLDLESHRKSKVNVIACSPYFFDETLDLGVDIE